MYGDPLHSGAQAASALHQPRRRLVALIELVVAAGLVVFAVWCWQRGTGDVRFVVQGSDPPLAANRYLGNWIGAAVGLCALAGFLLLDAVRQVALGLRVRAIPPRE